MNITRKIALVTGGSRGLGRNIALALARNGADVILTYRQRKDEGATTVAEVEQFGRKAAVLQLDVADSRHFKEFSEALRQTLEAKWQRKNFDLLVNNAGIDSSAPFAEMTEDNFDRLFLVHFKGVYFLTQTLLPLIADGGAIVNLSSGLARFAIPGYSAYGAMKGAIEVFTRYLAKELGPRRIRANVIAPGAIETDFTKGAFEHHPEVKAFLASQTALGRVGVPDDIGGVVAFLCSEEGRWVNSQRLEASGGCSSDRARLFRQIENKVVLITGASSGIGEATARTLAGRSARVVLGARREDRLEKITTEIREAGGVAAAARSTSPASLTSKRSPPLARSSSVPSTCW